MVVFLWVVASSSLLFLSPAQAGETEESPPIKESTLVHPAKDEDSIPLDPVLESDEAPEGDVALQSDAVWDDEDDEDDELLDEEEEELEESLYGRDLGNVRREKDNRQRRKSSNSENRKTQRNKRPVNKGNAQNPKGLKRKKVNVKAEGQRGQRRRPEGKKTKYGQKQIRKVAKSKVAKEDGALDLSESEKAAPEERRKREI